VVDTGNYEYQLQMYNSGGERSLLAVVSTDQLQCYVITGGSPVATVSAPGTVPLGSVQKGAGRVAANDFQSARNGAVGTADTSGATPTAPSALHVGHHDGAEQPFGYIRRVAVVSSAVSDANLQVMTT
jgi:hypothetical protein